VRRVIHFSSIRAFDQFPLDAVLDEARGQVGGLSRPAYDRSKARGEDEIRRGVERGLDAVILNPTGVIGPYDGEPTPAGQFFLNFARRRLPALVEGGADWVDVRDVVEATLAAATRGGRGEQYILGGRWLSMVELARLSEEATGIRPPRLECPIAVARCWAPFQVAWDHAWGRRPLFSRDGLDHLAFSNRRVSSAKAREALGFAPRPAAESVRDAFRWLEESGRLAG
jgi:dihydroflavonol-4-reductase